MIIAFRGISPRIDPTAFVAESADVTGDVEIGAESSIWFRSVVRGDINYIRIGERSNVQDGSIIHVTSQTGPVHIGNEVTIGHNAIIHGCRIDDGALIGMGAIVLDGAHIGANSLIAAGSLVTPRTVIPPRSFVLGSPAKVKRELTDEEVANLATFWQSYVRTKQDYQQKVSVGG